MTQTRHFRVGSGLRGGLQNEPLPYHVGVVDFQDYWFGRPIFLISWSGLKNVAKHVYKILISWTGPIDLSGPFFYRFSRLLICPETFSGAVDYRPRKLISQIEFFRTNPRWGRRGFLLATFPLFLFQLFLISWSFRFLLFCLFDSLKCMQLKLHVQTFAFFSPAALHPAAPSASRVSPPFSFPSTPDFSVIFSLFPHIFIACLSNLMFNALS